MVTMLAETHPGKVRDHNEDAYLCDPEKGLALIADGMGGHAAGEVASEITVKTFTELNPGADKLVATAMASHQRIIAHAEANPESRGMGSALVVAEFDKNEVSICWVGDSRAYLFNQANGLSPLTRDHSYVQWFLTNGQITEHQARIHPERNLVTQCLGVSPPQPELNRVSWRARDIVLLCSDGLTDEVDDATIAAILHQSQPLEATARQLIEAALDRGGKDNITIVLARNDARLIPGIKSESLRKLRPPTGSAKNRPWFHILLGVGSAILLAVLWMLFRLIF